MRKMNQKGFTLVEIMIVVAIIGLLAAIAIPNLLRARMNSNDGAVRTDLRTFSSANESFRAAQNPPAYAGGVAALTGAVPPYLDTNWNAGTLHGHNFAYATAGNTYGMFATAIANQASLNFGVDHTGVIFQGGGCGAAGCAGGTPIAS